LANGTRPAHPGTRVVLPVEYLGCLGWLLYMDHSTQHPIRNGSRMYFPPTPLSSRNPRVVPCSHYDSIEYHSTDAMGLGDPFCRIPQCCGVFHVVFFQPSLGTSLFDSLDTTSGSFGLGGNHLPDGPLYPSVYPNKDPSSSQNALQTRIPTNSIMVPLVFPL
jgi:hypothetical protein